MSISARSSYLIGATGRAEPRDRARPRRIRWLFQVWLSLLVLAQSGHAAVGIAVDEKLLNYGVLIKGAKIERTIKVFNTGDETLKLSRVSSSCSCTQILDFDKEIAAGKSGQVRFTVDTNPIKAGWTKKAINIFSNDPNQGRLIVEYVFRVDKHYAVMPEELEIRGLFSDKKQAIFTIVASGKLGLVVTEAKSEFGRFEVLKVEEVEPKRRYTVLAQAPAAEALGEELDRIMFTYRTADGRQATALQRVRITHTGLIAFEPHGLVRFTNRETDPLLDSEAKPATKRITVRASHAGAKIEECQARLEGLPESVFEARLVALPDQTGYTIDVSINEYFFDKSYVTGKLIVEAKISGVKDGLVSDRAEQPIQALFGKRRRR